MVIYKIFCDMYVIYCQVDSNKRKYWKRMLIWFLLFESKFKVKCVGKCIVDGVGLEVDFDFVDQWCLLYGYVINIFQIWLK